MQRLIAVAFTAVLLAACASTDTQESGAPVEDRSAAAGAGAAPAPGTSTTGTAGGAPPAATPVAPAATPGNLTVPPKDPASVLSKRSVYFDYDMFVVKDEYRPIIEAHARFLRDNRPAKVILQGHTDERGSPEYNLALGQKRAEAVRRALALLGATDVQIETVSFGEEKPRMQGSDEKAWAENRRADIKYPGE
jgi:peptidoglycan-associated lipoprotein